MAYEFKDKALERRALTHRSFGEANNERLEWLGDSLLYAAVSEILWRRFPGLSEGTLSEARVALIRNDTLAAAAKRAGFQDRVRLGTGEKGAHKPSILAAALEAHLGAAKLDGADPVAVTEELLALEFDKVARVLEVDGEDAFKPAKTRLQEIVQGEGNPPPVYTSQGADASGRWFRVECDIGGRRFYGEGPSVRRAGEAAARTALEEVGK